MCRLLYTQLCLPQWYIYKHAHVMYNCYRSTSYLVYCGGRIARHPDRPVDVGHHGGGRNARRIDGCRHWQHEWHRWHPNGAAVMAAVAAAAAAAAMGIATDDAWAAVIAAVAAASAAAMGHGWWQAMA